MGDAVIAVGQVRLDTKRGILVRIVGGIEFVPSGNWYYPVEVVLTGNRYRLRRIGIGNKVYNEMEVIAWAAR